MPEPIAPLDGSGAVPKHYPQLAGTRAGKLRRQHLRNPVVLKNSAALMAGLFPAWSILGNVMSSYLTT